MAWEIRYTYIAAKPFLAEHPIGSGIVVQYNPGDEVPASDWGAATNNMLEMGKIFQTAINVEVPDPTDDGGLGQGDDASSEVALPEVTEDEPTGEETPADDNRDELLEEIASEVTDESASEEAAQTALNDAGDAPAPEPEVEVQAGGEPETFPMHKGGGNYVLSDGTKVRGKAAAEAAQTALNTDAD